jgi:CNT family concentrative nucleoside transporter
LQRPLGISGRVGLGAAANVFVGMVEAPLMIREYLADMTRSELFIIMTTGMATVAGTVMVLYASILSTVIPDALGHLLTASIISAPAAILVALIMVPDERSEMKQQDSLDALTRGTLDGVSMLINIGAMLIVLVALVSLVNNAIGLLPAIAGQMPSLQLLLGYLMTPVARLMGIP